MRLYIMRHGQTDANAKQLCQGSIDNPLNDEGIKQATQLREKLSNIKFDYVYSSPLSRARQTCNIVTNNRIDILVDERLREFSFGDFEGTDFTSFPFYEIFNFNNNECLGGCENMLDFCNRVKQFLDDTSKKHINDGNILVGCHGGVLAMMKCLHEGMPSDGDLFKHVPKNCEVYIINNKEG